MSLDPQVRVLLDQLHTAGALPLVKGSVAETRRSYRELALARRGGGVEPEPVAVVHDTDADGVPVRVYSPAGAGPVVVWFHGGGWVVGDRDTHDPMCRRVANAVPAVVISVEYRLAPEHPFPAPLEDCMTAVRWAAEHFPDRRLGVGGDSAGANLAAAVTLRARREGNPRIAGQLLVYPAVDMTLSKPSMTENGSGHYLTAADMRWFVEQYLPTGVDRRHPLADLLSTPDLTGLPPAVVATAEFDPLRDEGAAYAERLREAGVVVCSLPGPGLIHGYFAITELVDAAREQRESVLEAFATLLDSR